jgi:hypothetical protein
MADVPPNWLDGGVTASDFRFKRKRHRCLHCEWVVIASELSDMEGTIVLPHSRSQARRAREDGCSLFRIFREDAFHNSKRREVASKIKELIYKSANPGPFTIRYHTELDKSSLVYNNEVEIPVLISTFKGAQLDN